MNRRDFIGFVGAPVLAVMAASIVRGSTHRQPAPAWSIAFEFEVDHEASARTGWAWHKPTGRRCWSVDGQVVGKREFIAAVRQSSPDMVLALEAFDESLLMTEHPVWPA